MQRLLSELRALNSKWERFKPSSHLFRDLHWWKTFLALYNCVSLIRSSPLINDDTHFCTDTSQSGICDFYDGHYFHAKFPEFIACQPLHINSLEILAVAVAVKLWSAVLPRQRIVVRTDKN